MSETVYRMAGELVPAGQMQKWHNDRGLPWGAVYNGPDPITIRRMVPPQNLSVHLANEHGIDPDPFKGDLHRAAWVHMSAHLSGDFRRGQEHYHRKNQEPAE
jgi:hypothetical protein